ncbi:MAG: LytTR family DNA-binding domain-containing protein [Chloroflexota bacterium]
MKILITDDEAPARGELTYILNQLAPEAEISEAKNGLQAVEFLKKNEVDVAFLDINMPGMDGLTAGATIIRELSEAPLIVFATAYSDHAIEAFEMAALDYVVKPFDEKRLAKTIERIRQTLAQHDQLDQQQEAIRNVLSKMMGQEIEAAKPTKNIEKIWGEREGGNRLLLDYNQILYVEAEQKKVFMYADSGEKLQVRQTLKELEERLAKHQFVRVHKGYLINLDHIAEVVPWFSGGYLIRLGDGTHEIPMSRRYAAKLKELTDW